MGCPSRFFYICPGFIEKIKKHTFFNDIDWIKLSKKQVPPLINSTEIVRIASSLYQKRSLYKFKLSDKDGLKVHDYTRDDLPTQESKLWRQYDLKSETSNLFPSALCSYKDKQFYKDLQHICEFHVPDWKSRKLKEKSQATKLRLAFYLIALPASSIWS